MPLDVYDCSEPAEEKPVAMVACDDEAWHWWNEEHPEEGSGGPYNNRDDAVDAARAAGYEILG